VIGGASVYYDYDHMSLQFSASLASPLLRQLPLPELQLCSSITGLRWDATLGKTVSHWGYRC